MTSSSADYELLEQCNETELYQNCRRKGLRVTPNTPKHQLILYLLGEEEPVASTAIDDWRLRIMQFLIEHRAVVEAQLNCPAKSMDPLSCFQCVDAQVINCLVQNPGHEQIIAAQRIVRRTPS